MITHVTRCEAGYLCRAGVTGQYPTGQYSTAGSSKSSFCPPGQFASQNGTYFSFANWLLLSSLLNYTGCPKKTLDFLNGCNSRQEASSNLIFIHDFNNRLNNHQNFLNFLALLEAELWLILWVYAIFLKFGPT